MKEATIKRKDKTTYLREFKSLDEFYNYITNTPLNDVFRWEELASSAIGPHKQRWTGTSSYKEAVDLFKNGWQDMAKTLTKSIKVKQNQVENAQVQKVMYDIVGFQASVPRYLQGIPTSMINKKLVPVKQRVITLNKDISYNASVKTEDIIEASVQTIHLIKKIEAQGIRVNLNLIWGSSAGETREVIKIKLKSANERINISKLAFPLVNPSMLRRLCFRYYEVAPTITSDYRFGYGAPLDGAQLKIYCKDEYVLPRLFDGNLSSLGDLSKICNITDEIVNGSSDKPKI